MALVLTKQQREFLKQKYGGCCSYCGDVLGNKWHADHFIPVCRESRYKRDEYNNYVYNANNKRVTDITMKYPEHDVYENMMPSCIKCNNDKSSCNIEQWRKIIVSRIETLNNNPKYASYQKAKKFGLVIETNISVVFYYEKHNKGNKNDDV